MRQRLGREQLYSMEEEVAVTSTWVDVQCAVGKGAENQAKRREPAPGFRLRREVELRIRKAWEMEIGLLQFDPFEGTAH